ncbi:MAG: ECF transporter S component [Anaerolineae bacterium]|jgi:energy-coupling factor transport system substrate-specific component|nr:ECF transporter S component [Anaerolineae bacterium]
MSEKNSGWNFNYTTRDIVIIAVIAAIAGVVNTGVGNLWYLLNSSLGALGGALLQGAFMWAYILAMWLVKKPGAALLVGLVETGVEILMGNASGIGTLGWGLTQGIGVEAVMAITRYKQFDLLTAMMAGAAASQFGTVWTAILFGWDPAYARDVWLAIPINLISGLVLSGVVGYYLAKALGKTGLVRSAA